MPSFSYVVKDRGGKTSRGMLEAASLGEAATKLKQESYFILQLNPAGSSPAQTQRGTAKRSQEPKTKGRVSLKDKMFLTKQFYVMMKAGLGMIHCLNNLFVQTENKYLQHIVGEARKDIEGGSSISVAFGKYPIVFDNMFIHMLEAGEASGKIDVSLARLNEYFEREYELRKKVVGALIYPAIICFVAVVVVIILMVAVLPIFAKIFQDAGIELPTMTRMLMTFSMICQKFWYLLPLVPGLLIWGFKSMKRNPKGREIIDKAMLNLPLFGDLIRKLIVARFARTFATLLDSGVPLLQSLEIVGRVVTNALFAKTIQSALVSVNRGTGLSMPLQESGMFPVMVSQMISVGEDTGDVSHMLEEVADYYDKEVGYAVENLTSMIEPLVIVVLGGIVAFIVAAIMIPMLDLSSGAAVK